MCGISWHSMHGSQEEARFYFGFLYRNISLYSPEDISSMCMKGRAGGIAPKSLPRKGLTADKLHSLAIKGKCKRLMGKAMTAAAASAKPLGRPKSKLAGNGDNDTAPAMPVNPNPTKKRGGGAIENPVKKASKIITQANKVEGKADKIQTAVRAICVAHGDQTARLSSQARSRSPSQPPTPMQNAFGHGHPAGPHRGTARSPDQDAELAGGNRPGPGGRGAVNADQPPMHRTTTPMGEASLTCSSLPDLMDRPGDVLFLAGPSYCGAPSAREMLALD